MRARSPQKYYLFKYITIINVSSYEVFNPYLLEHFRKYGILYKYEKDCT